MREPKPTYQKWDPPVKQYKSYKKKQEHKQVTPIPKELWTICDASEVSKIDETDEN